MMCRAHADDIQCGRVHSAEGLEKDPFVYSSNVHGSTPELVLELVLE